MISMTKALSSGIIIKKLRNRIVSFAAVFAFAVLFSLPLNADATTYTWDGGGADNNWSTCANWSSDTCPLASDSVIFSASSTKNATIDTDITVSAFSINSGYTGTVAPSAAQLITITGAFTQNAGTFTASSATTTATSTFTYTGGTFNHNNGIMYFKPNTSVTLTFGSIAFNNVVFDKNPSVGSITVSLASDMIVNGNLTALVSVNSQSLNLQSSVSGTPRTLSVAGNVNLPSTPAATGSVQFGGGSTFGLNVTLMGNFTIADAQSVWASDLTFASSSTQTISLTGGSVGNSWYDTGSGNLALTANFTGSQTLRPDGDTDFNFVSTPYTFSSAGLSVATSTSFTPAGPSSYAFTNYSQYTGTFNATASTTIGIFSQTGGTFNAVTNGTTTFTGNFTYTSGTFNTNSGTVYFLPSAAVTLNFGSVAFNNLTFDKTSSGGSITVSIASDITVNGNLVVLDTSGQSMDIQSSAAGTPRTATVFGNLLFPSTPGSASNANLGGSTASLINITLYGNFDMADAQATLYSDITFASSSTQTITKSNGTINSASDWFDTGSGNLALNADFVGSQTLRPDDLTDFTFAATPFSFTSGDITVATSTSFTPAGPSSYVFVNFNQYTGTFNATASTTIGIFSQTGGTFNAATNGTTTITGNFTYTGGTFNHNNGTVYFFPGAANTVTSNGAVFNNVLIDKNTTGAQITTTIASNMTINGNLIASNMVSGQNLNIQSDGSGTTRTLTVGGDLLFPSGSGVSTLNLGTGATFPLVITLSGNFNMSDAQANLYADVTFASSSTQTITKSNGTINSVSDWTISKPSGSASLATALVTSGTINIATGTLRTAGFGLTTAVSGLSVGASGNLQIQGSETISTSTFSTGGTMTYDGTSGPYTLKNFSYKNLIIQGNGATFNMPAALTIAGDLNIASGTFDVTAGNFALGVAGNWANTGTFVPRQGTVTLNGTGQSITGTTTFYNLTKSVASPDTLTFGAGQTQTVSNIWTANGASGNLLSLRSTQTGTRWRIDPQSTRTLSYIDVKDSNNVNASPIGAVTGVVNSLNNLNWGFDVTAPVASSIVITPSLTTALVAWSTDEAATSTLIYGLTSSYGFASTSLATSTHSVALQDLSPGTEYHYAIVSTDPTGNQATTSDATFTTSSIPVPAGSASQVVPGSMTGVSSVTSYDELVKIFGDKAIRPQTFPVLPGARSGDAVPAIGRVPADVQKAVIKKDAKMGDISPDVILIQRALNKDPGTAVAKKGVGSPGKETTYFGPATKAAVQKFQLKHGLVKNSKDPGYGSVGPKTRARMNAQ